MTACSCFMLTVKSEEIMHTNMNKTMVSLNVLSTRIYYGKSVTITHPTLSSFLGCSLHPQTGSHFLCLWPLSPFAVVLQYSHMVVCIMYIFRVKNSN